MPPFPSQRIVQLGVLASGNGSNLQALIDACEARRIPAAVAIVISDQAHAHALARAQKHGIPHRLIVRESHHNRAEFEKEIVSTLQAHDVELVCLAGFMRLVGKTLLHAFPQRVLNIHPALLPAFPGLDAQRQAWEYGVKVTGCTVHVVDERVDHGPIICQAVVEVRDDDTVDTLKARILEQEHQLYPRAVEMYAHGLTFHGRRIVIA